MNSLAHILLVDDDEVDMMTVRRAFTKLGTTNPLDHVWDGEEALAFLRNPAMPRPGLILLDLNMPRMNGLEFLEAVKSDAALKTIPVVVLTTSREESDRLGSFNKCVAGYIAKPVEYEQFVTVMRVIGDYWILNEAAPA